MKFTNDEAYTEVVESINKLVSLIRHAFINKSEKLNQNFIIHSYDLILKTAYSFNSHITRDKRYTDSNKE